MKKKKVMIIHHSGLIGGAGISFYNTWMVLEKKYDVVSYITDDPPDFLMFLRKKGLTPHTFSFRLGKLTYYSGGNNLLKPRFWYHALHSFFQIGYWRKIIKTEKPDLIIVNSKVLCWMGYLFRQTKSICFVRETIPGNPNNLMNRIMRNMLDKFSLVSFLSKYDLRETGLNKAKTLVAPNFLEAEDYKDNLGREVACDKLKLNSSNFNVLFVGGIDRLKGIDLALKAINLLKNENINLIVAGNDLGNITGSGLRYLINKTKRRKSIQFSKSIKEYIENVGINKHVDFIGVQSDMSLPFSACDILIFPMKEPHQARPVFEIGVQKKPVIITNFPNICEFVQNGVNGLTFEPNNVESLAQAILKLKNDKELLDRLGNCNYEHTIKYHCKRNVMDKLVGEIDDILS